MALMDTWSFGLGVVVLEGRRHLERTVVSWLTNMNSIFFGQTSFIVHISNPILLFTESNPDPFSPPASSREWLCRRTRTMCRLLSLT
jgi:hypothetical protein